MHAYYLYEKEKVMHKKYIVEPIKTSVKFEVRSPNLNPNSTTY